MASIKLENKIDLSNGDTGLVYAYNGVYVVKGTQTTTTHLFTGNIDALSLYDGMTIAYYLPRNGDGTNVTLDLTLADGTTTGPKNVYWNNAGRLTTHYGAGSTIFLTYWSAGSISVNGTPTTDDRWTRCDYDNCHYSGYCGTAGNTAAKYSSYTGYKLRQGNYTILLLVNSNTYAGALTLDVNGTGNKPLYINGSPSSATNYNLPAGQYLVYYDGTNYQVRTDGHIPNTVWENTSPTFEAVSVYDDSGNYQGTDNFNGHDVDTTYYSKGIDVGDVDTGPHYNISFPAKSGTFALLDDITTVNNGTLTIKKNGSTVATFTANQAGSTDANISCLDDNSSIKESKLIQDTYNTAGTINEYDRLLVDSNKANRIAFIPPSAISAEYTQDNGTTWTDYGLTDDQKRGLVSMLGSANVYIGSNTNTLPESMTTETMVKYKTRVVITNPGSNYCQANKFYCVKSNAHTANVTIEYALNSDHNTWHLWRDTTPLVGWSGPNMMTLPLMAIFGNNPSQVWAIRFTFGYNNVSASYESSAAVVGDFRIFGITAWAEDAMNDKPYKWDAYGNLLPRNGSSNNLGTNGKKWSQIH
ncbi:MAG: hypothetical protein HUJ56_08655, partial [Erysipelotrichaceae bacterium]|nr:hypothetical protein [Erysipelotrichaceae bacterium]